MLRAVFTSMFARKLRLALSLLSVVLGVAFVSGSLILTDSQKKAFDQLFATINADVSVLVRGEPTVGTSPDQQGAAPRRIIPESMLATIRSVPGVADAAPGVEGSAVLIGRDGKPRSSAGAPNIGTNFTPSSQLTLLHLVSGRAPTGPGEIAINTGLATSSGLHTGDTALVNTPAGQHRYTIVGEVAYSGGRSSLGGETLVLFDTDTAVRLLTDGRGYSNIYLAAAPGVSQQQLRDRVAAALPPGFQAVTGAELSAEQANSVKQALGFFTTFLLVFAGIALFVGAFIIFNTFTILIAQRSREMALLRAIGASRRQVTVAVLAEALVVGVLASAVGLGAGIGVAAGIKALFGAIGVNLPDAGTVLLPRTVVAAFAVGIGVTVVAALFPARRASRVSPLAALRDAATPDRPLRRLVVAGVVVTAAGVALLWAGLSGRGLAVVGAGALVTFVGVALLSPALSIPVVRLLAAPWGRGAAARLGRANSRRNPRRTAATAAALMIGIALVSALGVLGASTSRTIAKVTEEVVGADYLVFGQRVRIEPELVTRMRQQPGVGEVSGIWLARIAIDGTSHQAFVTPTAAIGSTVAATVESGSFADFGPQTMLVSAKVATEQHLNPGSTVRISFADGATQAMRVAATYADNQLLGDYVLPDAVADHLRQPSYNLALVKRTGGADAAAVRTELDRLLKGYPALSLQDRSEFVADQTKQVDQLLGVMNAMLALSVGIAVLGIVNTLALSVLERTRELGLLRAVGMSRRQVKRMIRIEALVIALFGGVLGLAIGTALGVAVQHALSSEGITELAVPGGQLVAFFVLSGVAGIAAAWLPARRAARLNILAAVATE